MSEPAIKRRLRRAKTKATEHLESMGYSIITADIVAIRQNEVRFIDVAVDRFPPDCAKVKMPSCCSREIFCQKESKFEIKEIPVK